MANFVHAAADTVLRTALGFVDIGIGGANSEDLWRTRVVFVLEGVLDLMGRFKHDKGSKFQQLTRAGTARNISADIVNVLDCIDLPVESLIEEAAKRETFVLLMESLKLLVEAWPTIYGSVPRCREYFSRVIVGQRSGLSLKVSSSLCVGSFDGRTDLAIKLCKLVSLFLVLKAQRPAIGLSLLCVILVLRERARETRDESSESTRRNALKRVLLELMVYPPLFDKSLGILLVFVSSLVSRVPILNQLDYASRLYFRLKVFHYYRRRFLANLGAS